MSENGSRNAGLLLAAFSGQPFAIDVGRRLLDAGLDFGVVLYLQSQKVLNERRLTDLTMEQLSSDIRLMPGDALKVKRAFPGN